jgi:hypothetical protein
MAKISKRFANISKLVEPGKAYGIDEALNLLKNNSKVKFVESVDVAVRLGVDAKKSDQQGARFHRAAGRHRQERARGRVLPAGREGR